MSTIENKAKTILQDAGLYKFPVDLAKLADYLSLRIIEQSMEDHISGLCYNHKGSEYIGVNSSHPDNRKRFTIAHEIGHLVLHFTKDEDVIVDTNQTTSIFHRAEGKTANQMYEREANQFAAALLMPRDLIESALEQQPDDEIDVEQLAKDFEVSEQAMTYRLLNLGFISYS